MRLLAILLLAFSSVAWSQDRMFQGNTGELRDIRLQFFEADIESIILLYENYTGRSLMQDPASAGKKITIQTSAVMTRAEAAHFIEHTFLLHGFAVVPTQDPDYWKLVATGDNINKEYIPIIRHELEIPRTEEVITYIAPLRHISPNEASEVLTSIVTLNPYGKVVALPSARSLIITESGSNVRRMLALLREIDLRNVPRIDKLICLQRASAEDVVASLTEIYSDQAAAPRQSNQRTGGAAAGMPGGVPAAAAGRSNPLPQDREDAPIFQAITRSNSVLVVSTPDEMVDIERLIGYLDAPSELANFIKIRLNYLRVSDFLTIAGDTLTRGQTSEQGGNISGNNGGTQNTGNLSNNNLAIGSNTGTGSSGSGLTGAASLGSLSEESRVGPQSLVVGKTLLVADNDHNTLIASGPPEDLLLIEELVKVMDLKSDQIQISAVIAQLTLTDDYAFGVDFLRTLPGNVDGSDAALGFRSRQGTQGGLVDVDSLSTAANLISGTTAGFNLFGRLNSNLDGLLSTLETTSRFKVLSRPTVYTINNRKAIIQTGQRVAVPRSTLSSLNPNGTNSNQVVTANIDFENVLLRVEVIPLINKDGQITLRINQSNDDIVGSQTIGGDQIPTIGTQALGTTIMVPDGRTVLLGGLISEEDRRDEQGLPLFANVPFLGRVAGSRADNVDRQELLIFIQPKIINSNAKYFCVDEDLIDRTRVGSDGVDFSEGTVDNLPSFEAREFESAEKRMRGFGNLLRKIKAKKEGQSIQAVPVFDRP